MNKVEKEELNIENKKRCISIFITARKHCPLAMNLVRGKNCDCGWLPKSSGAIAFWAPFWLLFWRSKKVKRKHTSLYRIERMRSFVPQDDKDE
jgi:hypothetical protein